MGNSSTFGSFARKAIAALIIAVVAIWLVSAIIGAVVGFVKLLFALALIVIVGYALLWAIRKL
jgi:hypothetical protein